MKYLITESQLNRVKSKINDLMLSDLNRLLDNDTKSKKQQKVTKRFHTLENAILKL